MSSSMRRGEKISAHVGRFADRNCVICHGEHAIYNCPKFRDMTVPEKLSEVRRYRLCFNCLRKDHTADRCTASGCRQCGLKHSTWLHNDHKVKMSVDSKSKAIAVDSVSEVPKEAPHKLNDQASCSATTMSINYSNQVLLATASVRIHDRSGREHLCRAFLDPGSQVNIIRKDLCKRLQLSERTSSVSLSGVGCRAANTTGAVNAIIHSIVNDYSVRLEFLVMERITERAPSQRVDMDVLHIPKNIKLSDQGFGNPGEIEILLGGGIFWDLLCVGQIRLGRSLPTLQKTKLGWIVAGNMPLSGEHTHQTRTAVCAVAGEPDLNHQLERFWLVEESPLQHEAVKETLCEEEFRITHKRTPDGRFVVRLPFQENPSCLGESRKTALRRLESVLRRLDRDAALKKQYEDVMKDYLKSGHMTRVDGTMTSKEPVYYLPHHAVIKEERETTKLRIVFDASCKTSSGKSLNDTLRVGPTIQSELFEVILRFREHRYVLTGDIERMYRQVYIDPQQRNLQRILWKTDSTSPVEAFVLNTVTFGVATAPFLAVRCLHQLAYECQLESPKISEVILKDFYMDDLITGADEVEDLKKIKAGVSEVLATGGFPMHKFKSNLPELIEDHTITEESMRKPLGEQVKTLGLYWRVEEDALTYRVGEPSLEGRVTKRKILSIIAQIYDPLGLVNPVIVQAKIFMQLLWQCKVGWDESLPEDLHTTWKRYCQQLPKLEEISVPRRIIVMAPIKIEVHGFCDASEKAYGACLYLRSINSENERRCRLICARSRVAPIKKISLPRLELCGALLLSSLMEKVVSALTLKIEEKHYWCDSTVALAWIGGEPSRWKTFVAHRVTEIQKISTKSQWHHVRSEENPADMLSRGVGLEKLNGSHWWKGPAWLEKEIIHYPSEPPWSVEVPEKRSMAMVINVESELKVWTKYSSLKRLKHVIAYCLRFVHNCKKINDRRSGWLSVTELEEAINIILKHHQKQHFSREIFDLRSGRSVSRKSQVLALNPFIDGIGLLRVGGRLKNAPLPYSRRFPVILANHDLLIDLIIRDTHLRSLHAGPEALLSMIRERYWIVSGRSAVRRVLRRCLVCYRFNCKAPTEIMGNLPMQRVSPGRAFLNVGIDYGGPFNIKFSRNKSAKAYMCLFVCFATRAIHLELVSDLSTAAFLNSLRRFIARRGKCLNIYSDNGTNFVGANNALQKLGELLTNQNHQKQVDAFAIEHSIQWHFLPPYAPHMGGLWEAGIKSAKTRLQKVLGEALLTFEEFYTLLTEFEACLNSRPLMPMSSDPSDLAVLTPGHFLIGEPLNAIQQIELSEVPTNKLTRYQLLIKLHQHFWTRWSQEYLSQLQSRSKWRSAASDQGRVQPNDMVILKENQPPLKWKLGRIVEVHPDNEGHVRIVSVKTENGIVKRPISKICILPMSD